jgi:hypothetical protein
MIVLSLPRAAFGYDKILIGYKKDGVRYTSLMKIQYPFPKNGAVEAVNFVDREFTNTDDLAALVYGDSIKSKRQ